MTIKLEGINDYNGFHLQNPISLSDNIIIITGKNGSGKTRLLESIHNGDIVTSEDGDLIDKEKIQFFPQASLIPDIGADYNFSQHQTNITNTLRLYDNIKGDLEHPYNHQKSNKHDMNSGSLVDYKTLFNLCIFIAESTGKKASELIHDDILINLKEPVKDPLGVQHISAIVNQYIQRLHMNEMHEWMCEKKDSKVQFFSKKDFSARFGDEPWVIINKILNDTFDGKFEFNTPDVKSKSYTYKAQLLHSKDQTKIDVSKLSSGEKSLFWLALTLFNCNYYDLDITQAPKIILIDEPDAFLHPKMVLKMYQVFTSFNHYFNSTVIISTHSPTTVALSPSEIVYLVGDNAMEPIEKDKAIAELLDGVSQISLNPNNRRQVYVESQYDADVYQYIFSKIAHTSSIIDPQISLNFISSGPKLPKQQIIDKARQLLDVNNEILLNDFATSLIGVGNCVQVIGQVEALVENKHDTVRGIIDWDLTNESTEKISVLAKGEAYSIENVTLDPICILLLLHIDHPEIYSTTEICGSNVSWYDWLQDEKLLQESVDRYIQRVLDRKSNHDSSLEYMSNTILATDSEYLRMNGHHLEILVKNKYPQLKSYCRKGKDGELKITIVNRSMIILTRGMFIPKSYEKVLAAVQK